MNLVIISDLHLHEWSYGGTIGSSGTNTRLLDQEYALAQVLDYCEQFEVKTILMGGDLFHTNNRVSGIALTFAAEFYKAAADRDITIYSLVGNHDKCGGGYHSLSWIGSPHKVVDSHETYEIQDRPFFMHAHMDNTGPSLLPDNLSSAQPGDVFLIHQGIGGADVGNGYVMDDEWLNVTKIPEDVQVIAGHYHKPQVLGNILIPGALNQHNWGDAGQKRGFWHWKDDNFNFIESRVARFHKFDMGMTSEVDQSRLEEMVSGVTTEERVTCYLKVLNWRGSKEDLRSKITTIGDGFVRGIEFGIVPKVENDDHTKHIRTAIHVDQDKWVKDWIKTSYTGPEATKVGLELYEGTYEAPEL